MAQTVVPEVTQGIPVEVVNKEDVLVLVVEAT
jgi:hypothetical protein